MEDAEKFSVGCGDQKFWDVTGPHPFPHLAQVVAWSDRRWSGSHYLAGGAGVFEVDGVEVFDTTGDDSVIVDHDAGCGFGAEPSAHSADGFIEYARCNVRVNRGHDTRLGRARTLGRPSSRDPVDLASGVLIHLVEAKFFEPPRGSGACVSEGVPAIDSNWSGAVEPSGGVGVQFLEGEVHRSRKVFLRVFFGRKNLD